MMKKVIVAGLLGWVVLMVSTFVANGIFGFASSINMKPIANERQVYMMLKDNIIEPGRYICNPEPTVMGFPGGEPVYGILYSGFGHEAAGWGSLVEMFIGLFASMIAAWMLSMTADRIMSSYIRRVLFFTTIGLFLAVFSEISKFGIGGSPLGIALILAVYDILQWTLVGLVVAWRMKPEVRAQAGGILSTVG